MSNAKFRQREDRQARRKNCQLISLAVAVNAGAALVYSTRVLDGVAAHTTKAQGA